jgi:hypothetical protein
LFTLFAQLAELWARTRKSPQIIHLFAGETETFLAFLRLILIEVPPQTKAESPKLDSSAT